jgi:hypothetical protein
MLKGIKKDVCIKKLITELVVVPNIIDIVVQYRYNNRAIAKKKKEPRSHQ